MGAGFLLARHARRAATVQPERVSGLTLLSAKLPASARVLDRKSDRYRWRDQPVQYLTSPMRL